MNYQDTPMQCKRNELISDLSDQIALVLRDYNIAPDIAEQCGAAVADHMANHWGGQVITIPKDYRWKLTQRDLIIWGEYNGKNHHELARKYGIGTNAIYRIVKRTGKHERSKRQPDLF